MLYDMLIRPFEDGDYFIGILMWIFWGLIALMILCGFAWCVDEFQWANTNSFEHECQLISGRYSSSTRRTHSVPVATGNGVGVGVVTTGESEKYVTIWDCKEYGRLIADDEEIFRLAQPSSNLYLKKKENKVRIVGIRN